MIFLRFHFTFLAKPSSVEADTGEPGAGGALAPKCGKLYRPKRNPLYNDSNYQLTVSEPGWNE